MRSRKRMSKRQSKRDFRKKSGIKSKNRIRSLTRGGYRL